MVLPKYAYFQGKIVPYADAKVGVMTHALNYGTGVFAGLRAYWNGDQEQLYIFRPLDHFHRFRNSAKLMCMDIKQTPEEFRDLTVALLQAEGYRQDTYIRPLAYKADEVIGVRLHDLRHEVTIFAIPFARYIENEEAHVTFSSWRRVDDNAIPARAKVSGAYVNSALVKTDAHNSGFDEALVLTSEGHVSEGSAMNVFLVRGGLLITPPVTDNILEGITRRTIMTFAREELGVEVVERPIDRTEVYLAEELFLTGTAAAVAPVTRVDYRTVADGHIGPITSRLRQLYDDAVRGRLPRYRHWNEPVYAAVPAAAN